MEALQPSMLFLESDLFTKVLASVVLVTAAWMIRKITYQHVRKRSETLSVEQRTLLNNSKMLTLVLAGLVLLILWLPSLTDVAISLAAFSVASVIAIKELILCLTGTWFRVVSRPFKVGDWVEIDHLKGEICDFGIYSTQLLELGNAENPYGYTGQLITIPNSLLLKAVIKNQTFKQTYAVHGFTVTFEPNAREIVSLPDVIAFVDRIKTSYKEKAYGYLKDFRDRTSIELKLPNPQVLLTSNEYGCIEYQFTLFCPSEEALSLQNKITSYLLANSMSKSSV